MLQLELLSDVEVDDGIEGRSPSQLSRYNPEPGGGRGEALVENDGGRMERERERERCRLV